MLTLKNKRANKLFILFAVVLALAMLIPTAVVGADGSFTITPGAQNQSHDAVGDAVTFVVEGLTANQMVTSIDVTDTGPVGAGAMVQSTSPTATSPTLPAPSPIHIVMPGTTGNGTSITLSSTTMGESSIVVNLSDSTTVTADKKWGKLFSTDISGAQDVAVVWNEDAKLWAASANVTDTVTGVFYYETPSDTTGTFNDLMAGMILHFYLLQDTPTAEATLAANAHGQFVPINTAISTLPRATFAEFAGGGTTDTEISGIDGSTQVFINADGEDAVLVAVVPEYPTFGSSTEFPIFTESTKVNFYTVESEAVPQVRWVGDKIVLEKYFGPSYEGDRVKFTTASTIGMLLGLNSTLNNWNSQGSVWDEIGPDGWARCVLYSLDQGQVNVEAAVYNDDTEIMNEHAFIVYFLKLESITLGNVVGKRDGHDSGLFDHPNPYVGSVTDEATGILNVSQDTLLRANVKGYFTGDKLSNRVGVSQDADPNIKDKNGNPVFTNWLPDHRWVLPDDWAVLAGPNWEEQRLHWDIMCAPNSGIVSAWNDPTVTWTAPVSAWRPDITDPTSLYYQDNLGLGNYKLGTTLIAAYPVVGPFKPQLQTPTNTGYLATPRADFGVVNFNQQTVVPDGVLDWWDAPMPPAKITFKIQDVSVTSNGSSSKIGFEIGDSGFFKDAWKTDIYYTMIAGVKSYTNPFYWEMIPANWEIPAFFNNGGYDWNSWMAVDDSYTPSTQYGAYPFWKIFNRPPNADLDATTMDGAVRDNGNYPAKAQVYTDNHGEAMIFLNGDYNIQPQLFTNKGKELPYGSYVGSTTVEAIADYPYTRGDTQIVSTTVTKTWTWGGMVLGPTDSYDQINIHPMILAVGDYDGTHPAAPDSTAKSNDLMIFIWATDRDGMAAGVLGSKIDWSITNGSVIIPDWTAGHPGEGTVSDVNALMQGLKVTDGFLDGTGPTGQTSINPAVYTSYLKAPTGSEIDLFNKFYGIGYGGNPATDPVVDDQGQPVNPANFAVAAIDLLDQTGLMSQDPTVNVLITAPDFAGNTFNYHYNVNFADAHPVDDNIIPGDANNDGVVNAGDITSIEGMILGLKSATVEADANFNDSINMGDVVKVERLILGLK
jgi:hypothetical protein